MKKLKTTEQENKDLLEKYKKVLSDKKFYDNLEKYKDFI